MNLKELTNKMKLMIKEEEIDKRELEKLRLENKNSNNNYYEQEKLITEYKIKNSSLEKQLQDKDEIIDKNKQIVENFESQKVDFIYFEN